MDEIANEKIVKEKDKKISFGLYDSNDTTAPWLILAANNNNNDDAKLNASLSTQNMEKEDKCCNFDYFAMQKKNNLRDQLQSNNKSDNESSIDEMPAGDATKQEANDRENGVKAKDNDTATDDDNNNDDKDNNENSFENLSYISEDENLGVIDDIVLLPNNLYSEDEMSNSDDCIYAYRGVDFEPIRSSPEDENDFLEMDFEPDPSSEIEQDSRSIRQNDGSENSVARNSNLPNRVEEDSARVGVEMLPNIVDSRVENPSNSIDRDLTVNGGVGCAFENSYADTQIDACDSPNSQNCAENSEERNDDVTESDSKFPNESCSSNGAKATCSNQQSSSETVSAPHAIKKYTGTIPKTNRNYLNLRSNRPKILSTTFGSTKIHRETTDKNYPSYMCKRWKNANSVPDAVTYQKCDGSQNVTNLIQTFQDPAKTKSNTKRSMSFPFEGFNHSEEESSHETQVVPTSSQAAAKLHSSQSQNQLFKRDEHEAVAMKFNGHCHDSGQNASVTIFTGNCTVDIISAALVRN